MRRPVVGVMGSDDAQSEDVTAAYEVGRLIAQNDWILLNGGRNAGVMDASAKGAHEAGGLTIGILPDDHRERASQYLDISVVTGMGSARNNINVLSSDVVIACAGGAGTLSEIALALKAGRPVVVLSTDIGTSFSRFVEKRQLIMVSTPEEAISTTKELLSQKQARSAAVIRAGRAGSGRRT